MLWVYFECCGWYFECCGCTLNVVGGTLNVVGECFLIHRKNFKGTQNRVRISHGERAIDVRAIEIRLYLPVTTIVDTIVILMNSSIRDTLATFCFANHVSISVAVNSITIPVNSATFRSELQPVSKYLVLCSITMSQDQIMRA